MKLSRSDIASLPHFLAVARRRNFRLAALDLGVTTSAISHTLKTLEASLGVRLVNRTNRSVGLTAAGEALYDAVERPFGDIEAAAERLNAFRTSPTGLIRLHVPDQAAEHLLAPVLPELVDRYPDLEIEIRVSNGLVDVIGEGYDAGFRYGNTVPEDMVAMRMSAELPWVIAASPDYIERRGAPTTPDDLVHHQCVRIRLGTGAVYRWEFDRLDDHRAIDVPGAVLMDSTFLARNLALKGLGLMYTPLCSAQADLEAGRLVRVLEEWVSPGAPFFAYYSSRRQVPQALRLLLDLIRERRPLGL